MPPLKIILPNGTTKLIDEDTWQVVAIAPPMQVRKHADGSTIVFASVRNRSNKGIEEDHGELFPPTSLGAASAISRIGYSWALPTPCIVDCLRQLLVIS